MSGNVENHAQEASALFTAMKRPAVVVALEAIRANDTPTDEVEHWADVLVSVAWVSRYADTNRLSACGETRTREELSKVRDLSEKLSQALYNLHFPAHHALGSESIDELGILAVAMSMRIEDRLSDDRLIIADLIPDGFAVSPELVDAQPKSGKPKRIASKLSYVAAQAFRALNGTRPGRSTRTDKTGTSQGTGGRYVKLLADLFTVFSIDASADSQAKKALSALE